MKNPSAYQAAINAGYSVGTARAASHNLMANPLIIAEIDKRLKKRAKKFDLRADDILEGILRVTARAEADDDRKNALRGYELLGKHLKLFTDVTETKHTFMQMGKVMVGQALEDESGNREARFLTFDVGEEPKGVPE